MPGEFKNLLRHEFQKYGFNDAPTLCFLGRNGTYLANDFIGVGKATNQFIVCFGSQVFQRLGRKIKDTGRSRYWAPSQWPAQLPPYHWPGSHQ